MRPARIPSASERGGQPSRRTRRDHGRLVLAVLLSLLTHTLLLSLTFDGEGLGLPGFGFPWRDRRIEAPDLRTALVPTPRAAQGLAIVSIAEPPLPQVSIEQPGASRRAPTLYRATSPYPNGKATAMVPAAQPAAEDKSAQPAAADPETANVPFPADRPGAAAIARVPEPATVDAAPSEGSAADTRTAASVRTSVIAAAPGVSSPETVTPTLPDADDVAREAARPAEAGLEAQRHEAERQEAARRAAAEREAQRQEAARVEAERQEGARRAAAEREAQQQDAARVEAARQEAARQETARLEVERQDAARRAAAEREAQRQEAARQEAARVEAARQEAARLEAERQEAARRAGAEREAQRQEAARIRAEQEEAREARLRAIGRQLDEEAARREAASTAARPLSTLPLSLSTARRVRLWGRADTNVELVRYAEAWERKIQLNTPIDTVRDVARRSHTNPMVTVAIRSDGSVESVTFVRSSGVAEVDDAIRRIVQSHEHYQAFPPGLAREFDVIEIRRTWNFDVAVRLY